MDLETAKQEIDELLEQNARISIAYLAKRMSEIERENLILKRKVAVMDKSVKHMEDQIHKIGGLENRIENAVLAFKELKRSLPVNETT